MRERLFRYILCVAVAALWVGCAAEGEDAGAVRDAQSYGGAGGATGSTSDAGSEADTDFQGTTTGSLADTSVRDAGGRDGGHGADSAPGSDLGGGEDAADRAPQCSDAYRKLVNASGPEPELASIPWTIIDGPAPSHRKKTIEGTWGGTVDLEQTINFDCPPTSDQLGLQCQTRRTIVIDRPGSSSMDRIQIATALPMADFVTPQQGTPVLLTMLKEGARSQLVLRRKTDEAHLLAIKTARSESDQYEEPESFRNDYGGFTVAMSAPVDDSSSAFCLLSDYCGRLLRIEPLLVEAESPTLVRPGETGDFQTADNHFRIWHLASYRRNQDLGGESSCSDVTYPAASYGFIRTE